MLLLVAGAPEVAPGSAAARRWRSDFTRLTGNGGDTAKQRSLILRVSWPDGGTLEDGWGGDSCCFSSLLFQLPL